MKKRIVLRCRLAGSSVVLAMQLSARRRPASGGAANDRAGAEDAEQPFLHRYAEGRGGRGEGVGVNLLVQAAEREVDVEKQMQIIENLIQSKVSALCVTPSGSSEIVPAIVKANRAGIPVVIVDTRVDPEDLTEAGGKIATFIGSDNFEGGKLAGRIHREEAGGKGKVAVLEGIPGHETGDSRLKVSAKHSRRRPGSRSSLRRPRTGSAIRDSTYFRTSSSHTRTFRALFACSDLMALGAVEAIAAAGRPARSLSSDSTLFRSARGGAQGHHGRDRRAIARARWAAGSRERPPA